MKILRCCRWLAHLHVVTGGKLQEPFDTRAGVFWALSFVAMRQKQHQAGKQIPLILSGADKLVDNDLAAIGKVAELRLPEDQRFRIIAAIAVFEAENARFGKRRIVNVATRLLFG